MEFNIYAESKEHSIFLIQSFNVYFYIERNGETLVVYALKFLFFIKVSK